MPASKPSSRRPGHDRPGPAPLGPDSAELHAVVHGHVQGVGFRMWTQRTATKLGLTGWVRNRSDGTVELVAQGRRSAVIELQRLLKNSLTPGSVDWLERQLRAVTYTFSDFTIR